jgi:hypothetical protein
MWRSPEASHASGSVRTGGAVLANGERALPPGGFRSPSAFWTLPAEGSPALVYRAACACWYQ